MAWLQIDYKFNMTRSNGLYAQFVTEFEIEERRGNPKPIIPLAWSVRLTFESVIRPNKTIQELKGNVTYTTTHQMFGWPRWNQIQTKPRVQQNRSQLPPQTLGDKGVNIITVWHTCTIRVTHTKGRGIAIHLWKWRALVGQGISGDLFTCLRLAVTRQYP